MPSFSHTVALPGPPESVFPWLLEPERVPRWTGHLEGYERIYAYDPFGNRLELLEPLPS